MILLIDKKHILYHAPALNSAAVYDFEADIFFAQVELLPLLLGDLESEKFLLAYQSQSLSVQEEHLLYLLRAPLALWAASIAALPLSTSATLCKPIVLQHHLQSLQFRYQQRAKVLLKKAQAYIINNQNHFPNVPAELLINTLFNAHPFQY